MRNQIALIRIKVFVLLSTLILTPLYTIGQSKEIHKQGFYVSKASFKATYKPIDSIGFAIKDKDTLIQVKELHRPEGKPVLYEYKDSTFLEVYKKIAFRQIHKDSSNSKPMKYWKDEIKIYFSKSISSSMKREFMKFSHFIDQEVDSLKISKVNKLEDSNYVIYNDIDYQFLDKMKDYTKSDYWVSWNEKNQIERGYIRIVKEKLFSEKLAIQKMKELFIGSLGWFNFNSELDCESYFAKCYSDNKHLTLLDIEILKYHYSYGICKGTRIKTFEMQHKESKKLLKKHNSKIYFYHLD
ncbi:MAG: hypothetical protein CMC76_05735 [Flavobacteriaceae bacterium]|nr:hypothetical protein [Flavobacteriaceae bacterium]|tara:strand:- start:95 stop:985 length:891 start_codon:yes stop_codon:yes gene_type:complete